MIDWLSLYTPANLSKIVSLIKSYISHYDINPQVTPDETLIAAVKALSIISHANDKSKHLLQSVFYIDKLEDKLNFKLEYRIWKKVQMQNPVTQFSYFNYPFLFSAKSKSRIIHIDSMVQMTQAYEDAHINQAFVHRAQQLLDYSKTAASLELEMKLVTNPFLILQVRRSNLLGDTLHQLQTNQEDIKKPLKVRFVGGGEDGVDQGGVQKEFFQICMDSLLDPVHGLFTLDAETRYSWFSPNAIESESHFELVGILMGLALYNGVMLGMHFPPMMYKKLLGETITLNDVKLAFPVFLF